jgi:hypothetical protein
VFKGKGKAGSVEILVNFVNISKSHEYFAEQHEGISHLEGATGSGCGESALQEEEQI